MVRRCTAPDPAERPRDIRSLRRLLRRCDRTPWIGTVTAAVLLAGCLLALLSARRQVEVEHRIQERVARDGERRAEFT